LRVPKGEFLMALAGPLVSLLLGAGFLGLAALAAALPVAHAIALYLGWINLVVAGFNLIPAFPMDGGRLPPASLAAVFKDHSRATKVAAAIGGLFGLGFIALGLAGFFLGQGGVMMVLLGLFLRGASKQGSAHAGTTLVEKPAAPTGLSRFLG